MGNLITINNLNSQQIHNIEEWITCIKGVIEMYTGRAIDDLDNLMGLLTVIASQHHGYIPYTEDEMLDGVSEQFKYYDRKY